jgi:hypothetical protein
VKLKVLALVISAFLVLAGSAEASQRHMRYGQAKHESRGFIKELCSEERQCTGYDVGQCYRQSESGFACKIVTFWADIPEFVDNASEFGEHSECNTTLHWGMNYSGYIRLKGAGSAHCFLI